MRGHMWMGWSAACLAALTLTGCGAGYELAPVRGKVICQEKPVPGGLIVFTPIPEEGSTEMPAPPATAQVDAEGNFVLVTDGSEGAMVGKHRVSFTIPEIDPGELEGHVLPAEDEDEEARAEAEAEREMAKRMAKVPCRRVEQREITVKPGENTFEIELTVGGDEED